MKQRNNPTYETLSVSDQDHVLNMVKRGCTRRDVMSWSMAAGASAAAAGALFTGAESAWAATPKRGGRLVMAGDQHGPADTLDPALFTSAIDYFRGRMFYGSLVRLQKDLSWAPELAEEVTSNSNATEWTFKLRKDVEFHSGKTMDADDVIYTMNRHLGENTVSNAAPLVAMVKEWKKVNKYEVKAVLNSPNADLPTALGTFHFKILQKGTDNFSTANGTGPYTVKEFKPGVRAVGVPFKNYWENDGGGYLDEIEHFGIGDPTARINAFLAGDVDAMGNLPPKAIPQIEAASGKGLWSLPSSAYINIALRKDMQPSGNNDLVMAMKYLMDRERLVKGVYKGQASLGNDHPIGPAYFDHCPDIPQRPLDHDKAAFHFKKSGVGSTAIQIVASEVGPGSVDQCLFLQREAKKIGLNIDVQNVTTDGYWSAVWLKAPICVASWNMRPTANIMMTLAFKSDAAWNETYHKDPEFDKLLVGVRAVTDAAKRREMYCTLQEKIHNENSNIIPVYRNYVDAAADYVKGRTYVPQNNFGGAEAPPYLWRDS
ncbi:MAG: ABC transporter substrate-binding protein [Rhodospirillales bacterium]